MKKMFLFATESHPVKPGILRLLLCNIVSARLEISRFPAFA